MGEAKVWKYVSSEGQLIGVAAAFPRYIQGPAGVSTGYVLGDFCISSKHRALGPALKLQKACMQGIAETGAVAYDLPSHVMQAVYTRIGVKTAMQVARYARPLRTGKIVRERLGNSVLSGLVAAVLDFGIGLTLPRQQCPALSIEKHPGPFGNEFTELASRTGARWGTCVRRSGEYLSWRYLQHPYAEFVTWTARHNGKLLAYVVTAQEQSVTRIVDLFGGEALEPLQALVTKVIRTAHHAGQSTVSFCIPAAHPWCNWLSKLGFRPREASAAVVLDPGSQGSGDWLILDADRES
ncbi:MAG TPA: hypothetical protein VN577_20875 [Terriglobales bacterium]|nr:hypothetical protein [Terriglobales bacterium]